MITGKVVKRFRWRWIGGVIGLIFVALFLGMIYPEYLPQPVGKQLSPIGSKPADCQRRFTPQFNSGPYYKGDLFDAHFHLPLAPGVKSFFIKQPTLGEGKDVTVNEILCLFDQEGTRGAIAFYLPIETRRGALSQAPEIKAYTDRLNLFISPVAHNATQIEKMIVDNPGLFSGIGEMQFYQFTRYFKPLDGKWAKAIYRVAAKHHLIVMLHPGSHQEEAVRTVIADNPDVIFLLHGHEIAPQIEDLIGRYPNVYFSIDGATLYAMQGKFVMGKQASYLQAFGREFGSLLSDGVQNFKSMVEKYPDRFMLGTDRGVTWHYNNEAGAAFEEFSRAFIARLDPSAQEAFAYKNAERLIYSSRSGSQAR